MDWHINKYKCISMLHNNHRARKKTAIFFFFCSHHSSYTTVYNRTYVRVRKWIMHLLFSCSLLLFFAIILSYVLARIFSNIQRGAEQEHSKKQILCVCVFWEWLPREWLITSWFLIVWDWDEITIGDWICSYCASISEIDESEEQSCRQSRPFYMCVCVTVCCKRK